MKTIRQRIMELGGCPNKESFHILCLAILVAKQALPVEIQMKAIWAEVNKELTKRKKIPAISKAIERGVDDVFTYGERKMLAEYSKAWLYEQPKPKDFIIVIASSLPDEI